MIKYLPCNVNFKVSVKTSQILTVLSPDPEASKRLSGLNDTFKTASLCPILFFRLFITKIKVQPAKEEVHLVTDFTRKIA